MNFLAEPRAVYYQRPMRARRFILPLVITLGACSSPEPRAAEEPAAAPTAIAPGANETARAVPPPAEIDAPDAGAGRPRSAPLSLGIPALLDFTREDCLPCQLMEPWLAELRKRHAGRIAILELDLEQPGSRDVARFFKARSVPLQVYVDARGREVARNSGLATMQQMQHQLEKLGFLERDEGQGNRASRGNGR
jgi:thiol-disulfide isomerase/thioredoxin